MQTKLIRGVPTTRDAAVLENIGLVRNVAHKYKYKAKAVGLDFEDLESIGAIGLLKAFDEFEEDKGFQFSTFATHKIFGEITRAILNNTDRGVRYPVGVKETAERIMKFDLKQEPVSAIAKRLKVSEFNVRTAIDYLNDKSALSLHTKKLNKKMDDLISFHEIIGKHEDFSSVVVNDFISRLPRREQDVVIRILNGASLVEIAAVWGKSGTLVGNYLKRVKEKLNEYQESAS